MDPDRGAVPDPRPPVTGPTAGPPTGVAPRADPPPADSRTPHARPHRRTRPTAEAPRPLLHRLDALINRERVRNYSWIVLVMSVGATVVNIGFGAFPLALSGVTVLPDYLAHWTGGRLLAEGRGAVLYDPAVQAELQRTAVPGSDGLAWFVSPPVAAVFYLPFAWLPYAPSALLWLLVAVALLAVAVRLVRPLLPDGGRDAALFALAFVATPPVFELVGAGQDTGVALVLVLLGIRLLRTGRELSAGAVLALGLIKPHLFVLVPVALLVQRRYRAFGSFVVVGAGLALLSLPLLGLSVWRAWLGALASPLYLDQVQEAQTWKMQSVSALLTDFGAPSLTAYPVLLAGAVALVLRLRRDPTDTAMVWALTVLTTVVFSPHAMLYDLVLLMPVLAVAYGRANVRAARFAALATVVLLWTVPLRHVLVLDGSAGTLLDAPWSALPLLVLWWLLMRTPVTGPTAS